MNGMPGYELREGLRVRFATVTRRECASKMPVGESDIVPFAKR